MKRLGARKTKTHVAGHQHCSTCHEATKSGRTLEKKRWRKDVLRDLDSSLL